MRQRGNFRKRRPRAGPYTVGVDPAGTDTIDATESREREYFVLGAIGGEHQHSSLALYHPIKGGWCLQSDSDPSLRGIGSTQAAARWAFNERLKTYRRDRPL